MSTKLNLYVMTKKIYNMQTNMIENKEINTNQGNDIERTPADMYYITVCQSLLNY